MKLINKADIEEILRNLWKEDDGHNSEHRICYNKALQEVQCKLDTLEVKEMDLKKEIQTWVEDNSVNGYYREDVYETAEHFFELGLKAKDWREERMRECPYRQVGCTMYSGTILECRGACSWVIDYPKLKELEEKKGE